MRETVAAFEKRTGTTYDPPPSVGALGRRLAPGESCPTLFRYPGPEGLRDLLIGQLRPQDRVAMVAYAGSAGEVMGSTSGAEKLKMRCALASRRTRSRQTRARTRH